ncbi:MAG: antirestriction protein [Planctomycetota bacterium]
MTTQQSPQTLVTRELVPEDRRTAVAERLFGIHFPLKLEPVVYGITDRMTDSYHGGMWQFYNLSNEGFYMAPSTDDTFNVSCDNQYRGSLSADALGITACLYAYSHLSFSNGRFARVCACHYHRLREYMFEHPEVRAILGATD